MHRYKLSAEQMSMLNVFINSANLTVASVISTREMVTIFVISCTGCHVVFTLAVSGPGQGPGLGSGRMGCMVFRRAFHTAPEQGQGRMGNVPVLGCMF